MIYWMNVTQDKFTEVDEQDFRFDRENAYKTGERTLNEENRRYA